MSHDPMPGPSAFKGLTCCVCHNHYPDQITFTRWPHTNQWYCDDCWESTGQHKPQSSKSANSALPVPAAATFTPEIGEE